LKLNMSIPADPLKSPGNGSSSLLRPLLVLAAVAVVLAAVYLSPLNEYLQHLDRIEEWLRGLGSMGILIFCCIVLGLTAAGVPRLIFCAIAGVVFGFWQGLVWCQLATLAGYYLSFLFIRWGGRDYVHHHWPQVEKLKTHLGAGSAWKVILLRQMPVTGIITNAILALSAVRHRDFLIGSLLGFLPQAIPMTLLGSSASHSESRILQLAILGLTLLIFPVSLLFRRFARRAEVNDK
jgi:uncharacterized membrane protein YdjX (TVP38/TMEM64 family)